MTISPLERLYPNRCYDCLAVTADFLCASCKEMYRRERERRAKRGGRTDDR